MAFPTARLLFQTAAFLTCAAAPAFAQPPTPASPTVVMDAGYQHETGLGRSGSFHGATATVVVPLRSRVEPVIKAGLVRRHERFGQRDVYETVVSLGVGGRVLLSRGSIRPWLQAVVGVLHEKYDRSAESGYFADVGGGVTVDITSRAGVYLSAGWRPTILGYTFSGSQVSVGLSLELGGR